MKPIALLSICLLALPLAAQASGLDASKPMRCSLAEAAECDPMADCLDAVIAEIDLPDAFLVDFAAKQLSSPDRQRTSPIATVETQDDVLLLQGHQNGRGWTMVIERATGHLAVSIASIEGALVLAGGCTAE